MSSTSPAETEPQPDASPRASMAERQDATAPTWSGRSRWSLLKDVIGDRQHNREKLAQLRGLLQAVAHPRVVRQRLQRLRDLGHCDIVPSVPQLLVASRDQLSFSLAEDTREFYASQGIPWGFHNLRRFIAYPTSMLDPTGLFCPRDTIVHHVLQTFHRHPLYDLVLLRAHPGGLEEMERQAAQIKQGTHRWQRALSSLIEDGSYHARLLDDVRAVRADPNAPARPIPGDLVDDPHLMLAMDQFKDLRGYTAYAARLQVGPLQAVLAFVPVLFNETVGSLLRVHIGPRQLRVECCEPELVAKYISRAKQGPQERA